MCRMFNGGGGTPRRGVAHPFTTPQMAPIICRLVRVGASPEQAVPRSQLSASSFGTGAAMLPELGQWSPSATRACACSCSSAFRSGTNKRRATMVAVWQRHDMHGADVSHACCSGYMRVGSPSPHAARTDATLSACPVLFVCAFCARDHGAIAAPTIRHRARTCCSKLSFCVPAVRQAAA